MTPRQAMPEIWLNYGTAEVVLDIRAENLERNIEAKANNVLSDQEIESRISALDFSRPMDIVVLDGSMSTRKIISKIFEKYDHLSSVKPSLIAAGDSVLNAIRNEFQDKAARVYGLGSSNLGGGFGKTTAMEDGVIPANSQRHGIDDTKNTDSSQSKTNNMGNYSEDYRYNSQGMNEDKRSSASQDGKDYYAYQRQSGNQGKKDVGSNGDVSVGVKNGKPKSGSNSDGSKSLLFVAEMEFDGLFGYNTVASRLLRLFGQYEKGFDNEIGDGGSGNEDGQHNANNNSMLKAYQKRQGNHPQPGGKDLGPMKVATDFVDSFEISAIETVGASEGIVDMAVGHPSSTMSISSSLYDSGVVQGAEKQKTMVISPGKTGNGDTLNGALNSLWNCCHGIKQSPSSSQQQQQQKHGGMAVLLAESKFGVGSESLQRYIEGRLDIDSLQKPQEYIGGMENLLFLDEIKKNIHLGLVSSLPNYYVKDRLGMYAWNSMKNMMDYILKTYGSKQKVSVASNGYRILLT